MATSRGHLRRILCWWWFSGLIVVLLGGLPLVILEFGVLVGDLVVVGLRG